MSTRAASPALVAARAAVSRCLADVEGGELVVVACSGGPDSLALVGVTAWVAQRGSFHTHAVVVDHGLQADSTRVAAWAAERCTQLGAGSAEVVAVQVGRRGGPEAAARDARYAALEGVAVEREAWAVLLGHTLEDQAETVLLRLARGSGARSLSAMRERSGPWRRPFLALDRSTVRSCADELLAPFGEQPWADPHNANPAFARVRVRSLLDGLTEAVGRGAVQGLARSADLLRDDADALDDWARRSAARIVGGDADDRSADCAELGEEPRAVRTRIIRSMCLALGCEGEDLTAEHVWRVESLISDWHGQGPVSLPGGVVAERSCGRLCLRITA
jgi:tRNA(Ile)-lysidine synthase